MTGLAGLFVLGALLCFLAGAIGLSARVNWDAAAKAALTTAVLAQWWPWGRP